MQQRTRRLAGRTLALAVIAALALPAAAEAGIGDITPLRAPGACNSPTGFHTGVCTPGSPVGGGVHPGDSFGPKGASHVVTSPDGKHTYVLSSALFDADIGVIPGGRIGVFIRAGGGALTPTSCLGAAVTPAPLQTPACVSSGNAGVDGAIDRGVVNNVAFSPDGRQLFLAGEVITVLDRDPATGVLTGRQAVGAPASFGTAEDVAVSPDGFNVYAVGNSGGGGTRLDAFARAVSGALVKIQCFNQDGIGGCQPLGGLGVPGQSGPGPLRRVRVSPDGSHVYAANDKTLIPLARNADGSLAPPVNAFGKQIACFSAFSSGTGCVGQVAPGLSIRDLELSPDGVHVYAGNTVLRRDAVTGSLSTPTPVQGSIVPDPSLAFVQLAVSPDGRTVYVAEGSRLRGFARNSRTMTLAPLAAPLGCFTADGSSGCQTEVPAGSFTDVALDATGVNVYLTSGDAEGAVVRAFSRVAGEPLPPQGVGHATLSPRRSTAKAGSTAGLALTWEHPHNWNDLARVELRVRAGGRALGRVVFDKRRDSVRLLAARGLRLERGSFKGNGPKGRRLTLRIALRVGRSLAGEPLLIDALASDKRGHAQVINQVGTLKIGPAR